MASTTIINAFSGYEPDDRVRVSLGYPRMFSVAYDPERDDEIENLDRSRPEETIETRACRELFMAVIIQAIQDVKKAQRQRHHKKNVCQQQISQRKRRGFAADNAEHWIRSTSREYFNSFETLCDTVGYDADAIRDYVFNCDINSGVRWKR